MHSTSKKPLDEPRISRLVEDAANALFSHWPEYLIEGACLGLFMISASLFGVLLEHPQSEFHQWIPDATARRVLMGAAMGLTAYLLITSAWGQRSGAHMNPAVTGTFLLLGKIRPWDALFYVIAQFAGGLGGMLIASFVIGPPLAHSAVNFVTTSPGPAGTRLALGAEMMISLLMMSTVLHLSNHPKLGRLTPVGAGFLVGAFIVFEAPYSGMSMNPARSFASMFLAGDWNGWWIYFVAPPAGMFLAAGAYLLTRGGDAVFCAKLHHHNTMRCIFRCNHGALHASRPSL